MHRAGQKIKAWRARKGPQMTQLALADLIGCNVSWVVKLENYGALPGLKVALRLAQLGVCEPTEFLDPPLPENDSDSALDRRAAAG